MKIQQSQKSFGEVLYDLLPRRYRDRHQSQRQPLNVQQQQSFTLRFLKTFGDLQDNLIDRIEDVTNYWFPRTCPKAALAHLASNIGFSLPGNIDEKTARLLIESLRTLYQYSSTEYALTVFARLVTQTDVLVHSNPKGGIRSSVSSHLSKEYAGDLYVEVNDASLFSEGDLITVYMKDWHDTVYIVEIDNNVLLLNRSLSYIYPVNSHVVTGTFDNVFKPSGLAGFVGIFSDTGFSDSIPTDASLTSVKASDIFSLWVEWHHVPDIVNLNTAIEIMEYFTPGRFQIYHIFRNYSGFLSDINVSDGFERTGIE